MNKTNIIEIREAIINLVNSSDIECFYIGIRAEIAINLGVAPNNTIFNCAINSIEFTINGNGTISAF